MTAQEIAEKTVHEIVQAVTDNAESDSKHISDVPSVVEAETEVTEEKLNTEEPEVKTETETAPVAESKVETNNTDTVEEGVHGADSAGRHLLSAA